MCRQANYESGANGFLFWAKSALSVQDGVVSLINTNIRQLRHH